MSRLIATIVLLILIYMLTINVLRYFTNSNVPASLILSGVGMNEVKGSILQHLRNQIGDENYDLASSEDDLETEVTYDDLNNDQLKDVVVIYRSEATCGSGGCLAAILLQTKDKTFEGINFSYAVKDLKILESMSNGMRDIRVNGGAGTLVWSDGSYSFETVGTQ